MSSSGAAPVLRFRNYRPQEATASATAAELVKPSDAPSVQLAKQLASLEGPLAALPSAASGAGATSSGAASAAADATVAEAAAAADPDSITIAPRKPNWDLKRDVAAKLDALNKQTERALAEMVRQKIAAGGSAAGSAAVGAGAQGIGSSAAFASGSFSARTSAGAAAGVGSSSSSSSMGSGAGAGAGAGSGREEAMTDDVLRAMETAESAARWGGAEDIDI